MGYTIGTGFSGIGVSDLAAELLGIETAWQIENNAFCLKVLEERFPDARRFRDIRDAHPWHVDVEVFGFPCQPFSNAGDQLGEDDERYLVPEMLRVIDETNPRLIILENVPGFASLDHGHSFKRLLEALAEMGFDVEWGHLRASDVGAPHQRERWFLVGYAAGVRRPYLAGRHPQLFVQSESDAADRIGGRHSAAGVPVDRRPDAGGARTLGHADRERRLRSTPAGNAAYNAHWLGAPCQRRGRSEFRAPVASGSVLVNTGSSGRQERYPSAVTDPARHPTRRPVEAGRRARGHEPRLGRNAHRLTGGLDFRGWPAGPGQAQYADEPPRLVETGAPNRNARIRALGNTMCFPLMFEIMQSALAWLQEVEVPE